MNSYTLDNRLLNTFPIRIGIAGVLALLQVTLFAFLLHVEVWYEPRYFFFRLGCAFVFYMLLGYGYEYLHHRRQFRYDRGHIDYTQYLKGLGVFILFSLLLYGLVELLPWYLYYGSIKGLAYNFLEVQLFTYMTTVIAGIYFCILSFFDILKNLHKARFRKEKYGQERAQAQLETLKNQISPHFLFNSLNALSSLIYIDEDKASRFVDELSTIFEYVLQNKDKDLVPLKEELVFAEAFFFLLKIRFRDNLRLHLQIPALHLQYRLPPLTLQLLIENAIKHNIVSRDEPLTIDILVEEEYLVIRNKLQLRETPADSTGVGLKNIIRRYEYLTTKRVEILRTQADFTARIPLLSYE
jgi:sensor histidine kinase YesM